MKLPNLPSNGLSTGERGLRHTRNRRTSTQSTPNLPRWKAGVDPYSGKPVSGKQAILAELSRDEEHREVEEQRRKEHANQHALVVVEREDRLVESEHHAMEVFGMEKGDSLLRTVLTIQEISRVLEEVTSKLDGRNSQLRRVLGKVQVRYTKCFERMLQTVTELQEEKDIRNDRKLEMLREELYKVEERAMELETENRLLSGRASAQTFLTEAQNIRIEELEKEVEYLRNLVRSESEDLLRRVKTPTSSKARHRNGVLTSDENTPFPSNPDGATHPMDDEKAQENENSDTTDDPVQLALEKPLNSLEHLVHSLETREEERELVLSNMSKLLEVAQYNAKRQLASNANFVKAKLRNGVAQLVELSEKGTMTTDKVSGFGAGSQEVLFVSTKASRETLWWRAFNFARCPRCKVDIQQELTADELIEIEGRKVRASEAAMEQELQKRLQVEVAKLKVTMMQQGGNKTSPKRGKHSPTSNGGWSDSGDDNFGHENGKVSPVSKLAAEQAKETTVDETNILETSILVRIMNQNRTGFVIPKEAEEFMAHLPKTITETPCRPVSWLLRKIDEVYEEKFKADESDRGDGLPLQALCPFLIEQLLFAHGLRRLAEVHLFDFLMAIRSHLKKHPRFLMFARFLDAVNCTKPTDRLDNLSVLQLFLLVRNRLLYGVIEGLSNGEEKNEIVRQRLEERQRSPELIVSEDNMYVPISTAVHILRKVFETFLAPRKVNLHCKAIEKMATVHIVTKLANGQVVDEVRKAKGVSTGERTTVRMNMRKAMLERSGEDHQAEAKSPGGGLDESSDPNRKETVVVNVDLVLETLVKVVKQREKKIDETLEQMFIDGDTDGDGVLSFEEFSDIVRKACPSLHDRKVLRMFRDACTRGERGSLSLTPQVFQSVCKDYDLVPIADLTKIDI